MTFHRKHTVFATAAAIAAIAPSGGSPADLDVTTEPTAGGFAPRMRGGKYRGPRNKPPSQAKRRLGDRRRGRFS